MVLVSGVDVQVGVGMLCFEVWSDVKCSVTRVYVCGVYVCGVYVCGVYVCGVYV